MNNKSFTLIELLVVIVIIGILAGVIMISTSSSIDKASFAKAQTFSNTVQEELLLNLVSEWTFNEGTTTTGNNATNNDVKDSWGNNNGTINATYAPKILGASDCVYGKCLSFDNDYVAVTNFDNDFELSISVWVNFDSLGNRWIINKRDAITHDQWQLYNYDGNIGAAIYGGDSTMVRGMAKFPQSKIKLNKWTHLTLATNGVLNGFVKIYLNGALEDAQPLTGNMLISTWTITIGKAGWYDDLYFDGAIDDIRIYGAVLSSSQIKQNYIAGLDSLLSQGSISKEDYNQRINELAYEK